MSGEEERIGKYRVHPVAAMFPLLKGTPFEQFKEHIEATGQLDPIIVQGDMLLDGRNRLRACLDLGMEPKVEEFVVRRDERFTAEEVYITADRFILAKNLDRRNLTEEQRVAIGVEACKWRMEQARLRKIEAGKAQGAHGAEGGRGHKKPLPTNSSEGVLPNARHDANDTVGQIAADTKSTRHRVAQALRVAKEAPEELDAVKAGTQSLREAAKKAIAKAPPTPRKKSDSYLDAKTKLLRSCWFDEVRDVVKRFPHERADLLDALTKAIKSIKPAQNAEQERAELTRRLNERLKPLAGLFRPSK